MKRINVTEAALIITGMILSFFFGIYKESWLFYYFTTGLRYAAGLFFAALLVLLAGIVVSIVIERGYLMESRDREWYAVTGRTEMQRKAEQSEFTDPEIEAMWNRSHYFIVRGQETPKGLISDKED